MSGSNGQQFAIRLALEGSAQVEAAMRQVQDAATRTGAAVQQAGDSTGRALVVIERGAQAASAGLTKMGGDAAAMVPVLENAGGAVGRLVTALGTGAGLLGVLGGVAALVTASIGLYQNWDAVTRGVGAAYDFLTGRVRASAAQIAATNELLREFQALSLTAPERQRDAAVATEADRARRAQEHITQYDGQIASLREQIARGRDAAAAAEEQQRLARAAGLPQVMDTGDPVARQRRLEADLRELEAKRADDMRVLRGSQGNVAALGEAAGTVINPSLDPNNDPNLPTPPDWREADAGGGGGRATDAELEQVADFVRSQPRAMEQYAEGVESAAQRVVAALDPAAAAHEAYAQRLRDVDAAMEAGIFTAERAAELRTAALRELNQQLDRAGDSAKDLARAGDAAGKALASAFEDLVFEGASFNDVLRNLERSLLRIGNQTLLQPLLQQGFNALFGGGGAASTGSKPAASGGGIAGLVSSLVSGAMSLFGGGGAGGGIKSIQAHDGALVGISGGVDRFVPAALFANAPRFHSGGIIGPDERPIIAQVGERVLNRKEAAAYARGGGTTVTLNVNGVRDVRGFRESEAQITASLARAIGRSGRNR